MTELATIKSLQGAQDTLKGIDRYVFIHIPRTGGSALLNFLFDNLGSGLVLDTFVPNKKFNFFKKVQRQAKFAFSTHRFVHIHVPVAINQVFAGERLSFFTLIRHPIDRILSIYDLCQRIWPTPFIDEPLLSNKNESLFFFLERNKSNSLLKNAMARHLALVSPLYSKTAPAVIDPWKNDDKKLKMDALEGLKQFYFIGLHEKFRLSLRILFLLHEDIFINTLDLREAERLSFPGPIMNIKPDYTRPGRREIGTAEMDLLFEMIDIDLYLYEYLKQSFYQRWGGLDEKF